MPSLWVLYLNISIQFQTYKKYLQEQQKESLYIHYANSSTVCILLICFSILWVFLYMHIMSLNQVRISWRHQAPKSFNVQILKKKKKKKNAPSQSHRTIFNTRNLMIKTLLSNLSIQTLSLAPLMLFVTTLPQPRIWLLITYTLDIRAYQSLTLSQNIHTY